MALPPLVPKAIADGIYYENARRLYGALGSVKYVVAAADEIPPGGRKIVDVDGRSIGIFNLDGEFFALRNRCPHQAAALCEGTLWGALQRRGPGRVRLLGARARS